MSYVSWWSLGHCKNGKNTGKGVYKFFNGDIAEGMYTDNKKNGAGIYKYGLIVLEYNNTHTLTVTIYVYKHWYLHYSFKNSFWCGLWRRI